MIFQLLNTINSKNVLISLILSFIFQRSYHFVSLRVSALRPKVKLLKSSFNSKVEQTQFGPSENVYHLKHDNSFPSLQLAQAQAFHFHHFFIISVVCSRFLLLSFIVRTIFILSKEFSQFANFLNRLSYLGTTINLWI